MARKQSSSAQKLRNVSNKAKAVGKELNKYGNLLQMVPYSKTAIAGANYAVQAVDSLANLMESFSLSSAPGIAGGPASGVAGVSNSIQVRRTAPKFRNSQGIVRVVHKELVATLTTSSGVALTPVSAAGTSVYQVNAGCGSAFPWLSQIASSYDYYRFKRLRLVYVPLCATSETGRATLIYDPDSTDPIPLDRQAISSYSCSTESSMWATQMLDCKLADNSKWYLTDATGVGTNNSSATNALLDQGQFCGATYGGSGSNTVGEIYALYDVELKDPQPNAGSLFQAYGNGATPISNFATNYPVFNNSGTSTTAVVVFTSPGRYFVTMSAASTGTTLTLVAGPGATMVGSNSAGNGAAAEMIALVSVTLPGASLTFGGLTGLANWTMYSTRLPYYTTTFF